MRDSGSIMYIYIYIRRLRTLFYPFSSGNRCSAIDKNSSTGITSPPVHDIRALLRVRPRILPSCYAVNGFRSPTFLFYFEIADRRTHVSLTCFRVACATTPKVIQKLYNFFLFSILIQDTRGYPFTREAARTSSPCCTSRTWRWSIPTITHCLKRCANSTRTRVISYSKTPRSTCFSNSSKKVSRVSTHGLRVHVMSVVPACSDEIFHCTYAAAVT